MSINRILIFDTTMRDGEQSLGASMNREDKIRIAKILEEMRVDIIETDFPIASQGGFDVVEGVAKEVRNLCFVISHSGANRLACSPD